MHDPIAATDGQPPGRDAGSGTDDDGVGAMRELTARLGHAIPSFLGLTVILLGGSADLTLTAVAATAEGAAQTSLGFSVLQAGGGSARFTLYAHQPGALVDLHADLSYLGHVARVVAEGRTPVDVRLDRDLPGPDLVAELAGLADQAKLHRAEGVLIEDGSEPDQVASELRRRAAAAGIDLRAYADQLLTDRGGRR